METASGEALRLDLWLAATRRLSRTAAHALVETGRVWVNDRPGRPGQRLHAGDRVAVEHPPPAPTVPQAGPPVSLTVVLEDDWLAVIDKPAGMVVHPAPGHPHGTLADGLRQRGDSWSTVGGPERAGIVHRLDRFTSGLLVVAKTEAAHRSLAAQLAQRTLQRRYWALVWGGFTEASGEIDAPVGRDPRHRQRMAVVDGGRPAHTDFRVLELHARTALLDVGLRSGRTHQVRVHLAHIGHPLVGDPLYGRRDDPLSGRPALHARRLRFIHPGDGHEVVVESPLPEDLQALLERARTGRL